MTLEANVTTLTGVLLYKNKKSLTVLNSLELVYLSICDIVLISVDTDTSRTRRVPLAGVCRRRGKAVSLLIVYDKKYASQGWR